MGSPVQAFVEHINTVPLAGLMLVVTAGFLVGRVRWRGVGLGPGGGTVLMALAGGRLGLDLQTFYGSDTPAVTVGLFGFCLFIYSIGFEAGPRLLSRQGGAQGWRFFTVGVIVNVVAVGLAAAVAHVLDLEPSTAAGILAGALTSVPTFAAASEIAPHPTHLSVAFAITYPLGLVGLVVVIQLAPRLMGASPRSPTLHGWHRASAPPPLTPEHGSPEVSRTFEVRNDGVAGTPLRDLDLTHGTGCVISRVHRGAHLFVPTAATELERGDRVRATGRIDELTEFERQVGPEVYDAELEEGASAHRVHVTNAQPAGKTLAELDLPNRFHVVVSRIESGETAIEPTAEAPVHRADVLELVGDPGHVREAARYLGRLEPPTASTDIAIYAGGILLGVLLGSASFALGDWDLSIGLAGGLLIAGLLLGRFRHIGPFSAHVPTAARQLVRDLGILLFVAEIGIEAGHQVVHVRIDDLEHALAVAGAVLLVPLTLALLVARRVLGLSPMEALGSVIGGLTSSAALNMLKRTAHSNEPAASFAAAYAVASVLVTIAGPVLIWIM